MKVLWGVDLTVDAGETVSIVGAGGREEHAPAPAGRTRPPDTRRCDVGGVAPSRLLEDELSRVRSRLLGFVFQFHHLLLEFSAVENVALPLLIQGVDSGEADRRAREILGEVGLAHRLEHRPSALSGGESSGSPSPVRWSTNRS